jgi:cytochrome P450
MAFEASAVGQALTTAMEVMMSALTGIVPVPPSVPTPGHRRARKAIAHLDELVYRIIAERRARPGDRTDVLTLLLAARDEDGTRMSDTQVRDEAMTLFLAGHETTANALFWTLLLLAENPEARAEIEAEIDAVLGERPLRYEDLPRLPLTLAALKEGMRLYPPAYILGRRAVREVKLGGHTLLPNTVVFINIAGMHRRPDLFPDAGRFELRRFEGNREKSMPRYAYMPFGAGPRICIGNHFALMEGHILLATLLRRVRLARPRDEVGTTPLITLRPRGDTRMAVTRRR